VDEQLIAYLRGVYGWAGGVTVTAGPRGALGQIWRVETGPSRYALKEILFDPPTEELVEVELTFTRRAAAAGLRLPASHADRNGRYVVCGPGDRWFRLYDWVDLSPVDLAAPSTPARLGALLARLHACAPATDTESDGGPPDHWYDRVPAVDVWTAPAKSDAAWAPRLAERLDTLTQLGTSVASVASVGPADQAGLVMCHRDLHPDNVFAVPDGDLVVVDWDNLGPADPGRELARVLFDWFCDHGVVDLDAVVATVDAYVAAGGPGRVSSPADFSMLLAGRLNFLLGQLSVALAPGVDQRHRDWAEREIDEALRMLPTPEQLAAVLEVVQR
jgi:Ser/Thr protein kinase RdoA (MazF antagonist)